MTEPEQATRTNGNDTAPAPAPTPAPTPAAAPAQPQAPSGPRGFRPGGARRPEGGRPRYTARRKVCAFCVDKIDDIDYKDVGRLRRYLTDRGKIEARRKTGTCSKHQRWLTVALKRARHVALLPYTGEHIRQSGISIRG